MLLLVVHYLRIKALIKILTHMSVCVYPIVIPIELIPLPRRNFPNNCAALA